MYVDLNNLETSNPDWMRVYHLCIGFINPRPIALVSTISAAGVHNLAPFSFYNMVSANPPVVMVCPSIRRDGTHKDTLTNIEATGVFAVATVTAEINQPMVDCAANLPPEQSEFEFASLTPTPATHIAAPLVKESPVNIECRLREIKRFGEHSGAGVLVFGDVIGLHIADEILDANQLVDPHKLRTVGRLGGQWYCDVTEPYELKIPTVD